VFNLSPAIEMRLRKVFPIRQDQIVVRGALGRECGANLHLSPSETERVRTAVLKMSAGGLVAFRTAVHLANEDWRKLLVSAGFEQDLRAHERWWP
jgi:hypothetical protein